MKLPFPVVMVEWDDAWIDESETEPPDWGEPDVAKCVTVGWLVRNTPELISVALEYQPNSNRFRRVQHVQKEVVRKITILKRTDGRSSRA
jgi:hypothetical protein